MRSPADLWGTPPDLLRHCDLGAADKCGVLIDHESRCFDIAAQGAAGRKLTAFCRQNIAFDGASNRYRFRLDLAFDLCVLADREFPG